jgi:hypothetical protein
MEEEFPGQLVVVYMLPFLKPRTEGLINPARRGTLKLWTCNFVNVVV